jgi:ATP-dependent DNA helicase RecG
MGELGEEGERFLDNQRFEGTISQMFEGTLAFVRRNMRVKMIVTDEGARIDKEEYPMKAVREIILNALIHRDYSIHTERSPIRLIMYDDRLELENPGGLYGRLTIDDLGKVAADTRNPYIAGMLEIMSDTENRFSGIPTVLAELRKAGMKAPIFTDRRGTFKVIFYNNTEQGKTISLNQQIINYCKTPRTREDLAKKFGFEAVSYFINTYINPLITEGRIKMTLPDTPKSKKQKYYS